MAGAGLFINLRRSGMVLISSIARRTNFRRFRRFSKNFLMAVAAVAGRGLGVNEPSTTERVCTPHARLFI